MQIRELTGQEIQYLLSLPEVNQRKTQYQTWIIDHLVAVRDLLVTSFTRSGKMFMCRSLFSRYRRRFDQPINVVVPRNNLKTDWEAEMKGIPGVRVWVINSYTMTELPQAELTCGILVVDEAHWATGENAKYLNRVLEITRADRRLLLSATMTAEQMEFCMKHGIVHRFDLPLKLGYRLGVVPAYTIFNVPLPLSEEERAEYAVFDRAYHELLQLFSKYSEDKTAFLVNSMLAGKRPVKYAGQTMTGYELTEHVARELKLTRDITFGLAMRWRANMTGRMAILHNAESKVDLAVRFFQLAGEQKALGFVSSIEMINKIMAGDERAIGFHSKLKSKKQKQAVMDAFYGNIKPHLLSIRTLNEGFTVKDVRLGLNTGYTSSSRELIQKTGRLLNFNEAEPDKQSILVNGYVDDFYHQGDLIESQEKKWLKRALKGQMFVKWVDDLCDVPTLCEDVFNQTDFSMTSKA